MRIRLRCLRGLLACAIALGLMLLPAFTRCVDAAGGDTIELPGAECCDHSESRGGPVSIGAMAPGCSDEALSFQSCGRERSVKELGHACPATGSGYVLVPMPNATSISSAVPLSIPDPHGQLAHILRC